MRYIRNYILEKNRIWLFTIAIYVLYIGIQIVQKCYISEANNPWYIVLIKLLPLILPIKVLFSNNKRLYIWLCFILFFYFISDVESIFVYNSWFSWLTVIFCVVLFVSCIIATRHVTTTKT